MRKLRILHITDFHINDFSTSSEEYLREDFYENYFSSLAKEILKRYDLIDCIVATGDFIHKGKTSNFDHASKVLNYLADKLFVPRSCICVCIGNHDVEITNPNPFDLGATIKEEDRLAFNSFANKYSNGTCLLNHHYPRFTISKIKDDLYFLSLDSTYNRKKNQPGKISNTEINELIIELKKLGIDNPSTTLIIASHYPLTYFDNSPFPDEEGWYDHHFWRSAVYLRDRISQQFNQSNLLWLFGDIHLPSEQFLNHQLFVMSGRIGTKIEPAGSKDLTPISRQARLIVYDENSGILLNNINYIQTEHQENSQGGHWSFTDPLSYKLKIQNAEKIIDTSGSLESIIIQNIKNNKLYEIGRFEISETFVSLGWVLINNLLTSRDDLLQDIIRYSYEWLKRKFIDLNESNTLFIGIDFWGSIIASHLSVITGCKNLCRASRGNLQHYSFREVFTEDIIDFNVKNISNLVFLTDVVSSGKTLARVSKMLCSLLKKQGVTVYSQIAISIICDRNQPNRVDLSYLSAFGTFCTELRIPVIDKGLLPSSDILPYKQIYY